jgi:hypothetical protein
LFSGVTAGPVVITNYTSSTASSGTTVLTIAKDYITIQDVVIYAYVAAGPPLYGITVALNTASLILTRVYSHAQESSGQNRGFEIGVFNNSVGPVISNCVFIGGMDIQCLATSSYDSGTVIRDSLFIKTSTQAGDTNAPLVFVSNPASRFGGISISNCSFFAGGSCVSGAWGGYPLSTSHPSTIKNCYLRGTTGINSTSTAIWQESYNIFECQVDRILTNTGTGSVSKPYHPIDLHISNIQQWGILPFTAPITGSYGISAGIASGAPTADIFGVNWLASPTIGSTESAQIVNRYLPTERNASAITIAPGATSKSIHLYLGATGLVYNTSGLQARYTRVGSNSVPISLVSQTSTGAWVSGGFAQIDAVNQPGLYRLDVPDAAFVAGVDRVTITVRGASGTNGAVVDCQLISSQLDLTQAVPTSNSGNTVGDCLNAARAQGFGKWSVIGTTLRLYAPDGTTVVRTFTLDSETSPSQRV